MDEIKRLKEQKKDAEGQLTALMRQKDRLHQYKTDSSAHPPPPSEFETLDPCATRKQHRMKVFLQQLGVVGLWHAIYTNARQSEQDEANDRDLNNGMINSSWRKLTDDCELGSKSRTLYYLMSIPEEVLMALVEGNLPSRMQEEGFRSKYQSLLSTKFNQGVYACYVGVAHQDTDSQSAPATKPQTGYGFTFEELNKVVETMFTYCDTNGLDDPIQAEKIDTCYRTGKTISMQEYQDGHRRYCGGGEDKGIQFDRIINFFTAAEENYNLSINSRKSSLNQLRLQRCFCYIGLSNRVAQRAIQHHSHLGDESPLWGLFTAVCKLLFATRFSISEFTYQIIQTTREADVGLDEILVSVLTSAYAFDGGLAAVHAGKHKGAKTKRDEAYSAELRENAKFHQNRGYHFKNFNATFDKFHDADVVSQLKAQHAEVQQELEAKLGDLKIKTDEAIKYYSDLIAHLTLQIQRHVVKSLKP